ncbi:MAG: ferritin-like domain-containing protein [Chitinophagaceae bacterium]|nr:MAG: ferritin-like domain-containing protein [Chitinophagaceae bacterium]
MLDSEDGLRKLLCDNLKDLYWAENHLLKALPKMASAASIQALQSGIMKHLEETTQQVKRLEQAFDLLGKPAQAKKCEAMQGLTQEGEAVIETTQPGSAARNLGIIMASQKVEHYEMSAYTGLYKLALKLGEQDVADLLNQTLAEETASDESLAKIAEEI